MSNGLCRTTVNSFTLNVLWRRSYDLRKLKHTKTGFRSAMKEIKKIYIYETYTPNVFFVRVLGSLRIMVKGQPAIAYFQDSRS